MKQHLRRTTPMNDIVSDFLSKNFFPGFKITNISFSEVSDKDITINLEPLEPPVCPHCGSHNVIVHEYRQRVIKDEKLLGCFVTLVITYRTIVIVHYYQDRKKLITIKNL